MVGEHFYNYPFQSLIMFNSCILLVILLHCVLIGSIIRYLYGQFLCNYLSDFVAIFPINISEKVIERLNNVA